MGYTGKSDSQSKKEIAKSNQKWLERKPKNTKQEKKHPWKRSVSERKAALDRYLAKYPKPKWAVEQIIRDDKDNLVEDICPHGCGHPNRAWLELHDPDGNKCMGIHGCDGCCDTTERKRITGEKRRKLTVKKLDKTDDGPLFYNNCDELAC